MYIPDRGDIIWLNFTPQAGHEQAGTRPALVLSPKAYNQKSGLALVCPITTKIKNYPFEARIQVSTIDGVILTDQIRSLDWVSRKAAFATKAPLKILEQVTELVELLLKG